MPEPLKAPPPLLHWAHCWLCRTTDHFAPAAFLRCQAPSPGPHWSISQNGSGAYQELEDILLACLWCWWPGTSCRVRQNCLRQRDHRVVFQLCHETAPASFLVLYPDVIIRHTRCVLALLLDDGPPEIFSAQEARICLPLLQVLWEFGIRGPLEVCSIPKLFWVLQTHCGSRRRFFHIWISSHQKLNGTLPTNPVQ